RGLELAEVVVDDAQHVVDVGEGGAARHGLLEMSSRQRIIAALEMLSAEGDQLPQLVVHALPKVLSRRERTMDHPPGGFWAGCCGLCGAPSVARWLGGDAGVPPSGASDRGWVASGSGLPSGPAAGALGAACFSSASASRRCGSCGASCTSRCSALRSS